MQQWAPFCNSLRRVGKQCLITKVDNTMEREIYIERIADEYQISKEAISDIAGHKIRPSL